MNEYGVSLKHITQLYSIIHLYLRNGSPSEEIEFGNVLLSNASVKDNL